jgi:small-conductance mechanosensitive channel
MPERLRALILIAFFAAVIVLPFSGALADEPDEVPQKPTISLPENMKGVFTGAAKGVQDEFITKASSLFQRTPLGWDWETIGYIYLWAVYLPLQLPELIRQIMEQSRILGAAGSIIMLLFLVAVIYSVLGRKRLIARIEIALIPLRERMPATIYPFFLAGIKVLVSALLPLVLFGCFSLVNAMIAYSAAWFRLTGYLLWLWAIGGLLIGLLQQALTRDLFKATAQYGRKIFPLARLALLYILAGFAVIRGVQVFEIRQDVLNLIKFGLSVSVVVVLFLLHQMKKALMSLLPDLPYRTYQAFVAVLDRYYRPMVFLLLLAALLWCVGYRHFGRLVLIKAYGSIFAYVAIMLIYHKLWVSLHHWYEAKPLTDEAVQYLFTSLRSILTYATVTATLIILLNLLGLLHPLKRLMSIPIVNVGTNQITLWIVIQAVFILLAFIYLSRFLQAYFDYKIYPSFGVDSGMGYALNTSLKYCLLILGILVSLTSVGIDLAFLLVFAGAAGIGIGLGMQQIAANIISGFTIIFGRKIRKGDWIEVDGKLGMVTDISLRATLLKTRDNIECLVPNANIISNTIINYTLSSPLICLALPFGVAYDSDPKRVEEILLEEARKEPLVAKEQKPVVRFVEFAESSLNFELWVWIDVRHTPFRLVRSTLYFAIFDRFKKEGIEIPFPQRDLHIRSASGLAALGGPGNALKLGPEKS